MAEDEAPATEEQQPAPKPQAKQQQSGPRMVKLRGPDRVSKITVEESRVQALLENGYTRA